MKEKIIKHLIHSDRFFLLPITSSFFSILVILIVSLVFYQKLPPRLPLFYSLPWGETQLANKNYFLLFPVILLIITLLNLFIALQLHPLQVVLKRMLMLSLVLVNLIILVTVLKILLIFI